MINDSELSLKVEVRMYYTTPQVEKKYAMH